ncbi:MAG TPA: hypothetical protein PK513_08075, partial [Alphaproteobacteria bacterium]|nr:hypothetical protein [Alphaproteobacteria bacterium]
MKKVPAALVAVVLSVSASAAFAQAAEGAQNNDILSLTPDAEPTTNFDCSGKMAHEYAMNDYNQITAEDPALYSLSKRTLGFNGLEIKNLADRYGALRTALAEKYETLFCGTVDRQNVSRKIYESIYKTGIFLRDVFELHGQMIAEEPEWFDRYYSDDYLKMSIMHFLGVERPENAVDKQFLEGYAARRDELVPVYFAIDLATILGIEELPEMQAYLQTLDRIMSEEYDKAFLGENQQDFLPLP